jgi:hypothetical protein
MKKGYVGKYLSGVQLEEKEKENLEIHAGNNNRNERAGNYNMEWVNREV